MRIVIIGGGKVGGYLTREMRAAGHGVIVVERDEATALKLGEDTDALVIAGDGCDMRILESVGTRSAHFFVAVTGRDEDNLVACQLARTAFGISKVLARLNDPRNRETFDALEVPVVSVTDLLVQVISRELDVSELARVALLGRGEVSLLEVEIPTSTHPRPVSEIALPASSVLVAIRRDGSVIVPGGETVIEAGDRVLAVTLVDLEDEVRNCLVGIAERSDLTETGRNQRTLTIDAGDEA
jgi:trk system potassium uptake protein TrkA